MASLMACLGTAALGVMMAAMVGHIFLIERLFQFSYGRNGTVMYQAKTTLQGIQIQKEKMVEETC